MIVGLLGENSSAFSEQYVAHPSQQYDVVNDQTSLRVPANRASPPENFYTIAPHMTHAAAHLLSKLLVWNPVSS